MRGRRAIVLAVALACGAAFPAVPSASPDVSQELLVRVQRACIDAYPEWLLAASTSNKPSAPGEDLSSRVVVKTDKGLFHSLFLAEIRETFDTYLKPGSRFLDLGSGDGRVVFMASLYQVDATGIEYDERLVEVSRQALDALDDVVDRDRVHLLQGDFFESPWSGYDVVYYFDLGSFEGDRLVKKLARELDPGALLLVAHKRSSFPDFLVEAKIGAIHVLRQADGSPRRPRRALVIVAAGLTLAAGLAALLIRSRPRGAKGA